MTSTPAGWYPDPENASRTRWWDGTQWTEHRSEPSPSSVPYSPAAVAASLKAPDGTPVNTVWIWLIVLLPLLPTINLFFIDWASMLDISDPSPTRVIAMFTDPGYLFAVFGGWILYGLSAWFAYLDWRELGRRGVPRPFHFAWVFLFTTPYPIGRSVVVRRRTGRGMAPLWVTVAMIVLSLGGAIYIVAVMMSAMVDQIVPLVYNS